jgi:AmiR/NasT family two-component response regulator
VATVGLLQERAVAARELLATQLQVALTSRALLEQAKGVLVQRAGLSMDQAFQLIGAYARSNNGRLSDVAARIIDGSFGNVLLGKDRRAQPDKPHQT